MSKLNLLRSVSPFSRLDYEELKLLADGLGMQSFKRGETIFFQGSSGNMLYIIVSGQVRIYTLSEMGQELSMTIFRAGDFFGELSLLDERPRSASAQAMLPTRTLTLDRDKFLHMVMVCPAITVAVLETLATRLRSSTVYAERLASYSAGQRIVHQLLTLATYSALPGQRITSKELHVTQDDLASLSGTTRETVNCVLSNLRDRGLVQVDRARIRILNPDELERLLIAW